MSFRKELISILKYFPHLNSISFTGYYGEPTLNENLLNFHKIASDVREEIEWTHDKPILTLFTNSSTLHIKQIRDRVKQFDLVLAKLDVATKVDFTLSNRPHPETPKIETIIDSIVKLKKEMPNEHKLAIQCLFYNSYREEFISNNNVENIKKLAYAIKKIKPDLVQIYSTARIPAEYFVFAIDDERKREIIKIFNEIIQNNKIKINYY